MKKEPFVSVVIPVHNRPKELERAVNSVLAQTYANYEIIIVDDRSADNTFEVARKLQQRDPRIRAYQNDRNGGGAYSRNQGVAKATGEVIAFLDSDDEWLPEKLEHQLTFMEQCDDNAVIASYIILKKGTKEHKHGTRTIRTGNIRKDLLMGRGVAWTSVILIRKEHFDRVGGFDDNLPSMQDYDLWVRLSEFYSCECVPEHLTVMHLDADVRISMNPDHRLSGIEMFLKKWAPTIKKEVGEEYVDVIRSKTLGTLYYNAAISALKQANRKNGIEWFLKLKEVDGATTGRTAKVLARYFLSFLIKHENI